MAFGLFRPPFLAPFFAKNGLFWRFSRKNRPGFDIFTVFFKNEFYPPSFFLSLEKEGGVSGAKSAPFRPSQNPLFS
jgi:hypothetical protein